MTRVVFKEIISEKEIIEVDLEPGFRVTSSYSYIRMKIKYYLLDETRVYTKDELFDIIDENLI